MLAQNSNGRGVEKVLLLSQYENINQRIRLLVGGRVQVCKGLGVWSFIQLFHCSVRVLYTDRHDSLPRGSREKMESAFV